MGSRDIKLNDKIMVLVLDKVAEGKDAFEICGWLKEEKGIEVTDVWLRRKLKEYRDRRGELLNDMIREKLKYVIAHDLDHVQQSINRAYNDEINARHVRDGRQKDPESEKGFTQGIGPKAGSERWSRLTVAARGHRNDLLRAIELRMKLAGIKGAGDHDNKPVGVVMLPAEQD